MPTNTSQGRRRKAPPLILSRRQAIGRYKDKFPNASYGEIADHFNCTVDQARSAIKGWQSGELKRSRPRVKAKSVEVAKEKDADSLLDSQFHHSIAQLEADIKTPASERIAMLEKLTVIRKTLQQVSLQTHIKKADAIVFAAVVRRFKPDASDEDIIKIYHEIVAELKL